MIRSDEDQTLPALGRLYPRYGGPEEIITPETSRLMPVEDPDDLATGIELVLDRRCTYNPRRLHQDVIAASAPWQSADESKPSTTRC